MILNRKLKISGPQWGYISVVGATVFFGIYYTFSKLLLQDLDPITLSALLYTSAGIFLFFICFSLLNNKLMGMMDSKSEAETFMLRKDYVVLIITAFSGSLIAPVVYLTGLNMITAVNASLLMNVEVLFIIIIGFSLFKESFNRGEFLGFFLIILGTIFLATNGDIQNISLSENFGTLLVIISAFFWSIDTTLSKFLSNKRDLLMISASKCLIGGLTLLLISLLLGLKLTVQLDHVAYLLFTGCVCIGFSFVMIYYAIRKIGSTRTGSIFPFSALFGAIFAFIILKEPFTYLQLLFGVLMLSGVLVIYKYREK